MPTIATLTTFGVATLAILILPGPSVVYVVTRSVEHGRRAGIWSVLGIETGAALHVAGACAGLAALLVSSPGAYTALRWAGAVYLVGLALGQFRGDPARAGPVPSVPSRLRLFRDGVLVDLLNPKTAVFFVAFLPQFVEPTRGPVALQVGVLGMCFVVLATVCDGAYALAAGGLAGRMSTSPRAAGIVRAGTCIVYLSLAGAAVFS